MDSAWPMHGHDNRHSGLSPYSTAGNLGEEKWWYFNDAYSEGSPVVDKEGIIYFGSWDYHLYAFYPNGTMKWKCYIDGCVWSSPAIDENGVLYVGTFWSYPREHLYAIYTSNGTKKWEYKTLDDMYTSPAIGDDGIIYYSDGRDSIIALYPNGTLKWKFKTNHFVHSDLTLGLDGTVYCGSHDKHLYALYPNNGTLKWKFKTGDWIARGACIADDGTVYFGSWDGHLYAVYPNNGTLKWKSNADTCTTPVLGEDGTIYVGYKDFTAVNPSDGSIKWKFNDVPGRVLASNPCVSADGIIYFGTQDDHDENNGGYLVSLNPDGTECWRRYTGECYFAPIIGEDGTIYVGSRNKDYSGTGYRSVGFLHAFGELDPDAPLQPDISGPKIVLPRIKYKYKFKSTSPLGRDVYYYVDWGDQNNSGWIGPYKSGELVKRTHKWDEIGRYTIRVKVKDTEDLWGPWGVINPRSKTISNTFFFQFLERFPLLKQLFSIYFS